MAEGLGILVKRAVGNGLMEDLGVGRDDIRISHMQYADDTLFTFSGNSNDIWAVKYILRNFEVLSGLSVNFNKCCLYGMNVDQESLYEMADLLGCRIDHFPINYLGIKVGGNVRKVVDWSFLVDKIRKRLNKWAGRHISFARRMTLINSILATVHVYQLSFALIPISILNMIKSLQCRFLWGENGVEKKISWVNWDVICKKKNEGGLGVRNLGRFNRALLGKWVWRFLVNKNSLWCKVLRSRHGELIFKNGCFSFRRGGGRRSGWWSKIVTLLGGENGKWFVDNLSMRLGNGLSTSFWEGPWMGAVSIRDRFPRLFHLSEQKEIMVGEMGVWEEEEWKWDLRWRMDLFGREIDYANELMSLLDRFKLMPNKEDSWIWNERSSPHGFVKKAYDLMSECAQLQTRDSNNFHIFKWVWKAMAPRNAASMAWRLMRERLPTTDNLDKRGVITGGSVTCPCCGVKPESANHLFVSCEPIIKVWDSMARRVGVVWTAPSKVSDHFWQFLNLGNYKKTRKKLGGLWICVAWVIWSWWNKLVFQNSSWDFLKIEEEINGRFWAWERSLCTNSFLALFEEWRSNSLFDAWKTLD